MSFSKFATSRGVAPTTLKRYCDYINPTIIEERKLNVAEMDVFSRLMMNRIVFLGTPIDADVSNIIVAQLLYLSANSEDPINIYINSPGGEVCSGFAIYDTIQYIKPKINTICVGMAASMGAIILVSGEERSCLPHGQIMIHQPWGGVTGSASDIIIEAKEIEKCRMECCKVISERTGKPYDEVFADMDRDKWFTAKEALDYNLITKIL